MADIEHAIGDSFPGELQAAGLLGAHLSWDANGVTFGDDLSADDRAKVAAVVAAHDPEKPGPATGPTPSCSKLGLKRAFDEKGLWTTVRAMIASSADMQEDWDLAIELRVTDPIVRKAVAGLAQLGVPLSDADVLALVDRANKLVA